MSPHQLGWHVVCPKAPSLVLLFSPFHVPLGSLISQFKWISYQLCRQYTSLLFSQIKWPPTLQDCQTDFKDWMSDDLAVNVKRASKNPEVFFDQHMNFELHTKKLVQSYFVHLRNISRSGKKIIHVFVSSRLDYCNSLLTTLSRSSVSRLQLVQNAGARLLTNTLRRSHLTLVLASLHCLPIYCRIDFKILLITYKALFF